MPSFLKDISKFYGTGEKNSAGQTLEEFLEEYDPYKYKTPCCTTDAVIFSFDGERCENEEELKVLLVRRSNHPSIGCLALPGGFINLEENLEDTARRELEEETGVKGLVMEQLAVYGDYDRDPRARVVTTAYLSLVHQKDVRVQAGDDAADAMWCGMELKELSREAVKTEGGAEGEIRLYSLSLRNEKQGFETSACVKYVWTGSPLIREEKFTVVRQGETASDHAAIIVQGLMRVKERLQKVAFSEGLDA